MNIKPNDFLKNTIFLSLGMNDTDAATLVTVNLFVRSFSKIDDVKMVC